MKTKVRKIGNSLGIIFNQQIIKQLNITDEVYLTIQDSKIIIEAVKPKPRENWEKLFLKANSLNSTDSLEYFDNEFDKNEWTW